MSENASDDEQIPMADEDLEENSSSQGTIQILREHVLRLFGPPTTQSKNCHFLWDHLYSIYCVSKSTGWASLETGQFC